MLSQTAAAMSCPSGCVLLITGKPALTARRRHSLLIQAAPNAAPEPAPMTISLAELHSLASFFASKKRLAAQMSFSSATMLDGVRKSVWLMLNFGLPGLYPLSD